MSEKRLRRLLTESAYIRSCFTMMDFNDVPKVDAYERTLEALAISDMTLTAELIAIKENQDSPSPIQIDVKTINAITKKTDERNREIERLTKQRDIAVEALEGYALTGLDMNYQNSATKALAKIKAMK